MWRMPRPIPSGGMSSPTAAVNARGNAPLAATPSSPLRCARRVGIVRLARAPLSVRLPGVPGAENLPRELVRIGTRQRLELLHAPREAIREIEIPELVRRDAVRAAEPPRLRAAGAPAIEEVAVEIELQHTERLAVAGPDEPFVVDEVIDDECRGVRRPVRRAQRP